MRKIHLTQGFVSLVDDQDFKRISRHGWSIMTGGGYKKKLYAQANIKVDGVWRRVLMHRHILGAGPETRIDHKNGNGLDNRRRNLRPASRGQNQHNSGRRIYKGRRTSRYKGVHWSKSANKWVAQIMAEGHHYYLGVFASEREAAREYDRASRNLHGKFAKTNFRH